MLKSSAVAMAASLIPTISVAATSASTIFATQGGYCADVTDDGLMQFHICGGAGPGYVSNLAYVDTRLDDANDVDRFARGALEFDMAELLGPGNSGGARIRSAVLTVQPLATRDLAVAGFPPPLVEFWGYAGNGSVNETDMFTGTLLGQFTPTATSPGTGPGGANWNPVNLDVTDWIKGLLFESATFAGFRFNIAGDLGGARNQLSEFYYGAPTAGVDGANDGSLAWRPYLSIVQVPEPDTLALLGLGLAGLGLSRRRKAA